MSDKRIVERLVLPAMMQTLIHGIRKGLVENGDDASCLQPIGDLLLEALKEPLADTPLDRQGKLVRRAMRVTKTGMESICAHVFSVQWYAIARLIVDLTTRDVIVVVEGSAFSRAWDAMISMGFDKLPPGGEETAEALADGLACLLARERLFI